MITSTNTDDRYTEACELVASHNKPSVSWLQRQLRVGYNEAAGLIERMEADGLVGAPDHAGRRTVLQNASDGMAVKILLHEDQLTIPVDLPKESRASDDRLRLLIERIERLEEEKQELASDIRDVFSELKSAGYDTKITRQIIRLRKMRPDDRREMEHILETYKCALGLA